VCVFGAVVGMLGALAAFVDAVYRRLPTPSRSNAPASGKAEQSSASAAAMHSVNAQQMGHDHVITAGPPYWKPSP